MSQDYRLAKLYESILRGTGTLTKPLTLSDLYEDTKQQTPVSNNPTNTKKAKKPAPSNVSYEEVIAHALSVDVNNIPVPVGNYDLTMLENKVSAVNQQDLSYFRQLFQVTPPKAGKALGTDATKGSGNGEVALYWLFNKTYKGTLFDGRGEGEPDLKITDGDPKAKAKIGIEVKSYGGGMDRIIGLGRFGEQHEERRILSVALGLKALVDTINLTAPSRMPSLDTFNELELTSAFEVVSTFDNNKQLRASQFPLIISMYNQIDQVKTFLGLGNTQGIFDIADAKHGAAKMMLAFLKRKLNDKPGFGGYMVDVTGDGKIDGLKIPSAENINMLDPDKVLKNVKADGATLKVNFGKLFNQFK